MGKGHSCVIHGIKREMHFMYTVYNHSFRKDLKDDEETEDPQRPLSALDGSIYYTQLKIQISLHIQGKRMDRLVWASDYFLLVRKS